MCRLKVGLFVFWAWIGRCVSNMRMPMSVCVYMCLRVCGCVCVWERSCCDVTDSHDSYTQAWMWIPVRESMITEHLCVCACMWVCVCICGLNNLCRLIIRPTCPHAQVMIYIAHKLRRFTFHRVKETPVYFHWSTRDSECVLQMCKLVNVTDRFISPTEE